MRAATVSLLVLVALFLGGVLLCRALWPGRGPDDPVRRAKEARRDLVATGLGEAEKLHEFGSMMRFYLKEYYGVDRGDPRASAERERLLALLRLKTGSFRHSLHRKAVADLLCDELAAYEGVLRSPEEHGTYDRARAMEVLESAEQFLRRTPATWGTPSQETGGGAASSDHPLLSEAEGVLGVEFPPGEGVPPGRKVGPAGAAGRGPDPRVTADIEGPGGRAAGR